MIQLTVDALAEGKYLKEHKKINPKIFVQFEAGYVVIFREDEVSSIRMISKTKSPQKGQVSRAFMQKHNGLFHMYRGNNSYCISSRKDDFIF
jgi:hypothetical protein